MFNKEFLNVVALTLSSILASTQGFASDPSGKGFSDENSTPSQAKRAKTDNSHLDSITPGPQHRHGHGIEDDEEDPQFLAALNDHMMTIEKTLPVRQAEQGTPEFELALAMELDKVSADYAARRKSSVDPRVVKKLFITAPDSPEEPQQKKQAVGRENDDELEPAATHIHVHAPEDEEDLAGVIPLAPDRLDDVTRLGLRIKLLANVYSGKVDATANIFVPQYVIRVSQPNGPVKKMKSYFKTDKGEICIFSSGGTLNHWEKSVGKVYNIFFAQKVKIIRWRWLYKHLNQIMAGNNPLDAYEGKETELHSELYYSLFFQHFFLPKVKQKYGANLKTLGIRAFSWWEVCDGCEGHLSKQSTLCESNDLENDLCEIAAVRKYAHKYNSSIIHAYSVAQAQEESAWTSIWEKVTHCVNKYAHSSRDKRNFWTKTVEGLELCKWLGQAFRENIYTLNAATAKPNGRGDILNYYNPMSNEDKASLLNLLDYLREENWELSCWYTPPYYDRVQGAWKAYAMQVVRPHFGWQLISEPPADDNTHECQMCGQKGLIHTYWVYHPKFRVTNKYFQMSEDQQRATEQSDGFNHETSFDQLPSYLQLKRRQSIVVGSECLKTLELEKNEVEKFRIKMSDEDRQERFLDLNEKLNQDDTLKTAESKGLLSWMTKKYAETKEPISMQQISRSGLFGIAADIHPMMQILIQNRQVEKIGKKYVVRK